MIGGSVRSEVSKAEQRRRGFGDFMSLLYKAYTTLGSGIFVAGLPPFWLYTRLTGRFRRGLKERLGLVPLQDLRSGHPSNRIWIHAASLGEVRVARSITNHLEKLMPGCDVILSTSTDHGHDLARELFDPESVLYAPFDFLPSVRKSLSAVNPQAMVFLETELWPAWITEAHRRGIPCALIHGRISKRSIRKYLTFRPFFRDVLNHIAAFSMITEQDARRIKDMGADPKRVEVNGNAKHDLLTSQTDPAIETRMQKLLGLKPLQPVLVGGSTREGEEELLLSVYKRLSREFPEMVLVIAPRHIVRTSRIEALVRQQGLEVQLWSDLVRPGVERTAPVVIVNTFGDLFKIYSVGTIIFCGASLVPLGGQNPFEPAIWGKMVFYGPSMEDFAETKKLLEQEGAGVEVKTAEAFADKALFFLNHQEELQEGGRRAREAVLRIQGASQRHAEVIARLMRDFDPS
jgi:3-deoxy-D-manno-octulosonic-acid transferase